MKLSIVIPVYRTEKTLGRCLESILKQSYADYEIILVDDGSPDGCPRLCNEWAERDSRISLIHKANGGLSDARNAGIDRAQGSFITFVDSDDTLQEGTLEVLMRELEAYPHVDVLEYPVLERYGNSERQSELTFTPREYTQPLDYWLGQRGYRHTYACNKIYRRSLFREVRFPKGKTFEDMWTTPRVIGLCPLDSEGRRNRATIRVTNQGRYIYHWNSEGITAKAGYRDLKSLYDGHAYVLDCVMRIIWRQHAYLTRYADVMQDYLTDILNILLDLYNVSGKVEPDPPLLGHLAWLEEQHWSGVFYISHKRKHDFFPKLRLKFKRKPKFRLKLKLLNVLGYRRLCKLNHLIYLVRGKGRRHG